MDEWAEYAEQKPEEFTDRARASMARQVQAMVEFPDAGAEVFDYGNSIRDEARQGGYERAFDFPGFVPAYIRPLFCEGKGPFRWVALSGDPKDIHATDRAVMDLFPDNDRLQKWMRGARDKIAFQGLPARICWLGYGERDRAGLAFNDLVASGRVSAPIVIGRDHLDCGSVASPYRETESMLDGSDAIADWPLLNALVNTASGASWVSIHHGGGVGIGRSHPRRSGLPGRRHRAGRTEAGPGADQRPRHGHHPARRRRVRAGRARSPRNAASGSRCASRRERRDLRRAVAGAGADRPRPGTGGYRRFAWTREDHTCASGSRASARPAGWIWSRTGWATSGPGGETRTPSGAGVVTGSHLDSVPDGGAFDGPLGVVSALAAVDGLRAQGFQPARPIGDRQLRRRGRRPVRGRLRRFPGDHRRRCRADRALGLRDGDGVSMAEALTAGRPPARSTWAPTRKPSAASGSSSNCTSSRAAVWSTWLSRSGIGTGIWPHGRWRIDFPGEANHAGTTRLEDRRDAMLGFAATVLAARDAAAAARLPGHGRARCASSPGGVNAIAGSVTGWLDARGADRGRGPADRSPTSRPARPRPAARSVEESWTPATRFDPDLVDRLQQVLPDAPLLGTGAGHDAGILAAEGIPAAMLFVRNPTGVSHSPAEWAERCRLPGRRRGPDRGAGRPGRACRR